MQALLQEATKTIEDSVMAHVDDDEQANMIDDDTKSILKQIELDLNRTMPGHELFNVGAEGESKLQRILVAYSIHINRAIGRLA